MRFCMFIFNDCLSLVFCLTTILTLFLFNRRPQGQEIYAPGVFTEILQLQIGLRNCARYKHDVFHHLFLISLK